MVTYCVAKMKPITGQLFETAIVASINKVLQTVFSHLKKQEKLGDRLVMATSWM